MKKIHLFILSLILILVILIIIFRDRPGIIARGEAAFSISDTSKVDRIIITGDNNGSIVLNRVNGNWLLNDSLPASPVAIDNFLFVMKRLRIKGIATDQPAGRENLKGIKISVTEGRKNYLFRYYSLNNMELIHKEGSSMIFPTEISGFPELRLSDVAVADAAYWRDRLMFSVGPKEILSVEVQYPDYPEKNFTIVNIGEAIKLLNPVTASFYPDTLTRQENMYMYLSYFRDVFFDDILGEEYKSDSIMRLSPDIRVIIESVKADTVLLEIWELAENAETKGGLAYLRKNEEREILEINRLIIDLWRKERADFLFK